MATPVPLLARAPRPAPTPFAHERMLDARPRSPCETCTPLVVESWIPIDITTTSCSTTTGAGDAWSTPSPSPWTAMQPAGTATATATTTCTVLQTATRTVEAAASATCCVRTARWPEDLTTPVRRALVNASFDDLTVDSRTRQKRGVDPEVDVDIGVAIDRLRFGLQDRMYHDADLLLRRWHDDPVSGPATVTVTTTQLVTRTSTSWVATTPTTMPTTNWTSTWNPLPSPEGSFVYGASPRRAADLAPSVVFLFAFVVFFVVGLLRLFACRKNLAVLINLIPAVVFAGGMLGYFGTRAWTSNNIANTGHIVASHAILMCLPLFLVEAMLQLFGLLAKRAEQSTWILHSSYALRLCNLVVFFLYVTAACMLQTFLDTWTERGDNCDSTSSQNLSLLPLVADWLAICCLVTVGILIVVVRLRHALAARILVHVVLVAVLLSVHFVWRILRDWAAQDVWDAGWEKWQHPVAATANAHVGDHGALVVAVGGSGSASCWGVRSDGQPDWTTLSSVRTGVERPAPFYLLGILPLLLALALLYMVNLPVYHTATATPLPPQPDPTARYKVSFNAQTKRIEMVRVDDTATGKDKDKGKGKGKSTGTGDKAKDAPAATADEEGRPYYRLVRSSTGRWKFKEAGPADPNGWRGKVRGFLFGWQ
ncbi:uncharacterized protein PSFLO_03967 [Pseudozyma flocculosa]|uniref:Uncharacterized protein n=1 Tax=Pseudozyma flocculosa TaxID=84751 RepID=A0A5C3F4Z8_9BASI|nr:uncharacterized protein PSFLO_03967 [Pseudozyma flocculosa]